MGAILHINGSNFSSEVLESDKPVLVDFSAVWCGPCQRQTPILESFADGNGDRVKVCKVDVDESPEIASKYGIRSVPTLMFFKDGKDVQTKIGMHSVAMLETLLQSVIKD